MTLIPLLHAMLGSPKYPGIHSQIPLWYLDSQMALTPQLTKEHAKTQLPWAHVLSWLQSLSVWHWGLALTGKKGVLACCITGKENVWITTFTCPSIACKCAFWAKTGNTPERGGCVSDHTLLRAGTGVVDNAGVLAGFTHASLLWRTVPVHTALWVFSNNS